MADGSKTVAVSIAPLKHVWDVRKKADIFSWILDNSRFVGTWVTLRYYSHVEDSITGDVDERVANDIGIKAEIQYDARSERRGEAGELQIGDATMWAKPRYTEDRDGTALTEPVEIHLHDEVFDRGNRLHVSRISPFYEGDEIIMVECRLTLVDTPTRGLEEADY